MKEVLLEAKKAGAKLEAVGGELRVIAPPGALSKELQQKLRAHKEEILRILSSQTENEETVPQIVHDESNVNTPFPLTELQHAYWVGRDQSFSFGNIATHVYIEMENDGVDLARLNEALCELIDRHDMLRMVVTANGMQRILPSVPRYQMRINDRSKSSPAEVSEAIASIRSELSHQVLDASKWPLFDIRATVLPDSRVRLHLSIDMLVMDAASFGNFFNEWYELYQFPKSNKPAYGISFRDYVCAARQLQESRKYQQAREYWIGRLDTIPPAPDLPMKAEQVAQGTPRFVRRNHVLEKSRWEKLKVVAGEKGLTPTGILLAAYGEVLARWSTTQHFTLNVIIANRHPIHEDINKVLGVFTSVIMQEVDRRDLDRSFEEFAKALQQQSAQDMRHRDFSGVTLLREWAKQRGIALQAVMPVVFNSTLVGGDGQHSNKDGLGQQVFSSAQTSQVYLENHVSEHNGDLILSWDAIDAVFESGVLDAMFGAYCTLINRLSDAPDLWAQKSVVTLPDEMQARRDEANHNRVPTVARHLHSGFVNHALDNPQAPAVLSPDRNMTYGELIEEAAAVADWLLQKSLGSGQPVAIVMRKGWEQIVAVYGVLLAGGAYMPIDADLPLKRKQELLNIGGVNHVLTQPDIDCETLLSGSDALKEVDCFVVNGNVRGKYGERHAELLARSPSEMAYVIFTSGTTGVPKGVMIDHVGAMNTIENVNRLLHVTANDRVLAVSSLSFDLSVYDIFGIHDAGGALVIPDAGKGHDPKHWQDLIEQYNVTLWNSAPQLMGMLIEELDNGESGRLSVRTVMMSGDWIPLQLPHRIKEHCPGADVVALGGATEASIWSNYYRVKEVKSDWKSIPYGKPLPNQTMWVYDKSFHPCPDFVPGKIYIGGVGVALGYWRDERQTEERFVRHPETGERLYDTGDLGKYAPEGDILILGRSDRQVKIRGYRVELDEIESVINAYPPVRRALVISISEQGKQNRLAAYVQFTESETESASPGAYRETIDSLKNYLSDRLPDYMVPQHFVLIDTIPLSRNGKVDYKSLPAITDEMREQHAQRVEPRNELEKRILAIWVRALGEENIGVTDSFFEFGGDSITAAQLVREINSTLSTRIEMHEFFENHSVEAMAKLIGKAQQPRVAPAGPRIDTDQMKRDVREISKKIEGLRFAERRASHEPRAIFLTGATGWLGVHMLSELLSATGAEVYCLVRKESAGLGDEEEAVRSLRRKMTESGNDVPEKVFERVRVVVGDLSTPGLGIDQATWDLLSTRVDAIYHLAADLNLAKGYSELRKTNVESLVDIVTLAVTEHLKPVHFVSPINVCMRYRDGRVEVNANEGPVEQPDGLLTGYSQSKWGSEQILLAASARGLPVKIYRSSHALPSSRNGYTKPKDTFMSLLRLACDVGVIPEWNNSYMHGLPVDILAKAIVKNSLTDDSYYGVIHVDNKNAPSVIDVLETLMTIEGDSSGSEIARVPFEQWKEMCLKKADDAPSDSANLAKTLVVSHGGNSPIEHMFGGHLVEMDRLSKLGESAGLAESVSSEYWRRIATRQEWAYY